MSLHRVRRILHAHPRLFIGCAVGASVGLALPPSWAAREITRWIVAWNCGAWLYLMMTAWLFAHSDSARIHRRARLQDEGARTILALVAVASLTSLGAIVAELSVAKDLNGAAKWLHIGLALATVLSSWAFTQVMFALHYAHKFYAALGRGEPAGLVFPDTATPHYLDFLYFSVVIGTSGQTADVAFASSGMRRVGMVHCVLAFVFNTSLIGLTINVASSLV